MNLKKKEKKNNEMKEKSTEAAKINELEKKEKKNDEMKDKFTEAAKINELEIVEKNDDKMVEKYVSVIFGYDEKKSMDIILNHVDSELRAVDGKL